MKLPSIHIVYYMLLERRRKEKGRINAECKCNKNYDDENQAKREKEETHL